RVFYKFVSGDEVRIRSDALSYDLDFARYLLEDRAVPLVSISAHVKDEATGIRHRSIILEQRHLL
ncbi:unnamed protein product, partial [Amoebophrya sp. A25]